MAEYLGAPGFANQVIVLDYPAVGLELTPCLQGDQKMLMPQPRKLHQIAVLRRGAVAVPSHVYLFIGRGVAFFFMPLSSGFPSQAPINKNNNALITPIPMFNAPTRKKFQPNN